MNGMPESLDDEMGPRTVVRAGSTLQAGAVAYAYDDLGRVVQRGALTVTYGPLGQVSRAFDGTNAVVRYVYDENGQRVLKRRDGRAVEGYLLGGYLDDKGFVEPVKVGGRLVAAIDHGVLTLLDTDPRGSVMSDGKGALRVSPFGARARRPQASAAFDYVEKGYDADLGAVRMGTRDYDPRLAQFWTADPLLFERLDACASRPSECNLYGYAGNDPVALVDPDGRAGDTAAVLKGFGLRMAQHMVHDPMMGAMTGPVGQGLLAVVQQFVPAPVRALDADASAGTLEKFLPTNQAAASWVAADASTGAEKGAHLADTHVAVRETIELALGIKALGQAVGRLPAVLKARMPQCSGACGTTGCFTEGTPVHADTGTVAIESIAVGDRIHAHENCGATEVDPATWRTLELVMPKHDGSGDAVRLVTARSLAWMVEQGAAEGAWIDLTFEELGIAGVAQVVAVGPAPRVAAGEGCVVLSTMEHRSGDVLELRVAGVTLEVTRGHRFFSADRDAWVTAGDIVAGERLRTRRGVAAVESVAPLAGTARVYNIEVESRHTYYVGRGEVLTHNTCGGEGAAGGAGTGRGFFEGTRYTQKVLQQMRGGVGEFHSFPQSVTAFESAGTVRTITGGDGVVRQMLEIPGSYGGRNGVFQFIKEADGAINHRLFVPGAP